MSPTPGAFASTVTQWVKTGTTTDAKNNKIPTFARRSVRALAEFPGLSGAGSARPASTEIGNTITADRVLLLTATASVSAADEFTVSDGLRYRVQGVPAVYRSPFTNTAVMQVNLLRIS